MSATGVPAAGASTSATHYTQRPSFPADLEVLVVDSVKASADLAKKLLASCSYRVTVCKSCVEAVSVLSKKNVDVIIAEMKLLSPQEPGMSQLKARAATVPLVALSDAGSTKDIWNGISFGAVDVLSRPLSRPKLQTLWQHVVRKQGSLAAAATAAAAAAPVSVQVSAKLTAAPAKPEAAKTPAAKSPTADSKKRKAKDMSSAVVPLRPPLAIKPSGAQASGPVPFTFGATMPVPGHQPAAVHPGPQSQMLGYWAPPVLGPPPAMIPGGPRAFSWGHPVVGMPPGPQQAPMGVLPGQPQPWARPAFPAGVPPQVLHAGPAGSAPMVIAHPAAAVPQLAAPPQAMAAEQQQQQQQCKLAKFAPLKVPDSPDARSDSGSSKSEGSTLQDLISDNDLVSIPEPESMEDVCSVADSGFTGSVHPECKPTALDDISDEEYAFVDFALSDAFPSVGEDEVLPPLGLALKKSDSLLNILNVQMVY